MNPCADGCGNGVLWTGKNNTQLFCKQSINQPQCSPPAKAFLLFCCCHFPTKCQVVATPHTSGSALDTDDLTDHCLSLTFIGIQLINHRLQAAGPSLFKRVYLRKLMVVFSSIFF